MSKFDASNVINLLEERVAQMHPVAGIADRINTASLVAEVLRGALQRDSGERVLDRARDEAEATIDRITHGCDHLVEMLHGMVPHPRDEQARVRVLVDQLRSAASGSAPLPKSHAVETVCDRLFAIASADVRFQIANAKKPKLAAVMRAVAETTRRKSPAMTARTRASRRGPDAPKGWIYVTDAIQEFNVARTTLDRWCRDLGAGDKRRDEDTNRVLVRRSALKRILSKRNRKPG